MKTGSETRVSAAKTGAPEDKVRKSLHTLQPAATDKENLVGGGRTLRSSGSLKEAVKETIKDEMSTKVRSDNTKVRNDNTKVRIDPPKNETSKRKKTTSKDKAIQASREKIKVEVDDLTSEAGPSENYWEVIAERRRIALQDALEENRELHERIAKMEEEIRISRELLDEARAVIEVIQEEIIDDRGDINNSLDDSVV